MNWRPKAGWFNRYAGNTPGYIERDGVIFEEGSNLMLKALKVELLNEDMWLEWVEETSDFLGEGKGDAIPLKLRAVLPRLICSHLREKVFSKEAR